MHSQYAFNWSGHAALRSFNTDTTQPVTSSPSFKHGLGSPLFLSLHRIYAAFTPEQRTATCFEAAINNADVGVDDGSSPLLMPTLIFTT